MERGDTGFCSGDLSGGGDEEGFVEGDEEDKHDVGDGLEGGWGDFEGLSDVGVHGGSLLDGEGLELCQDGVEHYGACKNGDNGDEDLYLFYLGDGAELPWTLFSSILNFDAGLIKEAAGQKLNITS